MNMKNITKVYMTEQQSITGYEQFGSHIPYKILKRNKVNIACQENGFFSFICKPISHQHTGLISGANANAYNLSFFIRRIKTVYK